MVSMTRSTDSSGSGREALAPWRAIGEARIAGIL
jgi:hypothetical protein